MNTVELSEIVSLALIAGVLVGGLWGRLAAPGPTAAGTAARWRLTPGAAVAGALTAMLVLEALLLLHR